MSDCQHKHRRIRWEKDHTLHTCKMCHATWTEPRPGAVTPTGTSDHETKSAAPALREDGSEVS